MTGGQTDFLRQLPLELRCEIFSYFDLKDIVNSIFVSIYFYDTIRNGPGAVSAVSLSDLIYDSSSLNQSQTEFYLNVITDKSRRPIKALINYSRDELKVDKILKRYKVLKFHSSLRNSGILASIESSITSLDSLRELKFGFEKHLDFNNLAFLSKKAPNLEVLNVSFCYGLEQKVYVSPNSFLKLKTLRIYAVRENIKPNNDLRVSSDSILSSFISKTPNLSKLALLGKYFEHQRRPSLCFAELLPKLEQLGVEIPQSRRIPDDSYHLPYISGSNSDLIELSIKADIYSHDTPTRNPLRNIRTLYFDGSGCINALKYYGVGPNLKRLYLKSPDDYDSPSTVTSLCKKCPNLEELVVIWFNPSLSWILETVSVHCPRLRLISFDSIATEDNKYNFEPLLKIDTAIKDIYLNKTLPEEQNTWLTDNGFNLYTECGYGFHIFSGGLYGGDTWLYT